jgi:hypothetical protein
MSNRDYMQEWKLRELPLESLIRYYHKMKHAKPDVQIRSVQGAINRINAAYDESRKEDLNWN